jgi:hypothetical protein
MVVAAVILVVFVLGITVGALATSEIADECSSKLRVCELEARTCEHEAAHSQEAGGA